MPAKKSKKQKIVTQAPPGAEFWINYGSIVADLIQLKDALNNMSERTYDYHVSKEKNDFAKWVEGTLGEKALAKKLKKAKSASEMANMIEEFIG